MAGTALSILKARVLNSLVQSSSEVEEAAVRGINFGAFVVALTMDPRELYTSGSVVVTSGGVSVTLTTLTKLNMVKVIYNSTNNIPVLHIPFGKWFIILPPGTGEIRVCSQQGTMLHTAPVPSEDTTLDIYYTVFPTTLVNAGDVLSFEEYDEQVVAIATAYAWASLEEAENTQLWTGLSSLLNIPETLLLTLKGKYEGGDFSANNIQGT